MTLILGLESSCDETAAALLRVDPAGRPTVLATLIASQHEIHTPFGGVVPELASRRHLEVLLPLVRAALAEAGATWAELDAVAVTYAPGLVGALLVGLSFGKALAYALGRPCVAVSHLEGHLAAPRLEHPEIGFPHLGLIVSGGHTALYHLKAFGAYELLGGTRDDAAGEAYDKVAKLLGLGYPGGPAIDRRAPRGNPKAFALPRPRLAGAMIDFSFSGLKSAVARLVKETPEAERTETWLTELCASFQNAVVTELVEKTLRAARELRLQTILVTGGVACNAELRRRFAAQAPAAGVTVYFAAPSLSTDNAAMIAFAGAERLRRGETAPLNLNAVSHLPLAARPDSFPSLKRL